MLINELIVPAPAWGAALPGARVPWLTVEPSALGHGRTYALTSSLGYAARPDGCRGCPRCVAGAAGTNGVVAAKVRPLAAANGLPTNNMKQFVQIDPRQR